MQQIYKWKIKQQEQFMQWSLNIVYFSFFFVDDDHLSDQCFGGIYNLTMTNDPESIHK